jgi:hypothetical protein
LIAELERMAPSGSLPDSREDVQDFRYSGEVGNWVKVDHEVAMPGAMQMSLYGSPVANPLRGVRKKVQFRFTHTVLGRG